jgi:hypothetical protein
VIGFRQNPPDKSGTINLGREPIFAASGRGGEWLLPPDISIVVTDPEDATKFVEIARSDIEELLPASESLMPKGLLDGLNETEVLDLVAYVLSQGNRRGERFKRP